MICCLKETFLTAVFKFNEQSHKNTRGTGLSNAFQKTTLPKLSEAYLIRQVYILFTLDLAKQTHSVFYPFKAE